MSSTGALSGGTVNSHIYELEGDLDGDFGTNPITASGPSPAPVTPKGFYGRFLDAARDRIIPDLLGSAVEEDMEEITLSFNIRVADGRNALSYTNTVVEQSIKAIVTGPSIKMLEKGFLSLSDHVVKFSAKDVTVGVGKNTRVTIGGVKHSIARLKAVPRVPAPVAYILWCKRSEA